MPPNAKQTCYPVPYQRHHRKNTNGAHWRALAQGISQRRKGIFIAAGVFLCFGIAGELDYRMQQADAAQYRKNVEAGIWPAYNHTCSEDLC